jgi:hypothetical protein
MAQSQHIEFLLQPPSPGKCTLPSVNSLLEQDQENNAELPLLCLPSPSLSSSSSVVLEPIEPSGNSPSLSPLMNSLSLDSNINNNKFLLLPPPNDTRRSRSLSNASSTSSCSSLLHYLSDSSSTTTTTSDNKRKRGRPPNNTISPSVSSTTTSPTQQRENWTFVTPTVWDVHHQHQQQQQQQPPVQHSLGSKKQEDMVLHWSTPNINHKIKEQHVFTNTNLDTALTIPKKKRGRKPKMQLAGNFCFVWRDLTARRGANKKKLKK